MQRRRTILVVSGKEKSVVAAFRENGDAPAIDFLESLPTKNRAKFQALFEHIAEEGEIRNVEKFKLLNSSDGIYEFKSDIYRILCFMAGGRIILTNGSRKNSKTIRTDIKTAQKIKQECLEDFHEIR